MNTLRQEEHIHSPIFEVESPQPRKVSKKLMFFSGVLLTIILSFGIFFLLLWQDQVSEKKVTAVPTPTRTRFRLTEATGAPIFTPAVSPSPTPSVKVTPTVRKPSPTTKPSFTPSPTVTATRIPTPTDTLIPTPSDSQAPTSNLFYPSPNGEITYKLDGKVCAVFSAPQDNISSYTDITTYFAFDGDAVRSGKPLTQACRDTLGNGPHTMRYYSVDAVGNTEEEKTVAFVVNIAGN